MQYTKTLKALAMGVLITMSASCVYDPHYYGPPAHPRPSYYYPWGYYYYPSVQVYFHYSTGFYYYPSNGIWIKTRVLPPRFRLDPRDRVHLRIENDKPYLHHQQQVEKYRPPKDHKPVPERDRLEREVLRKWYQEQEQYKKNKRFEEKPRKGDKEQKRR